jgi:ABC-2 type transport system permease protein
MTMGLFGDSISLYNREMMIFMANIRTNAARTAIFPIVILVFFSFLGSAIVNVPVVVVNYANNAQSLQLISSLNAQNLMQVRSITTEGQAFAMLAAGEVNFAIVILPNFPAYNGEPSVQVYYNNVQYSVTASVLPAIQQRISEFAPGASFQSQQYLPSNRQASDVATPITGATGNYEDFLFSGVIGMVIVFSAMFGAGLSIMSDRQGGNIKAFLITPINKSAILLGRLFASAVQSVFTIVVVIIIGVLLGNTIEMGVPGFFLILILGVLLSICMTSISLIIGSRLRNLQAFQIFGQATALPLWFISGGIFPVSSFPHILQIISVFDPMTYALDGFRYVILEGVYPIGSMVTDVIVLIIFAVIAAGISIRLFKSTIE